MKTTNQNKKTSAKRKVTGKRKTSGKVYIPKYKIVVMCLGVIAVCMILLLITNLIDSRNNSAETKNNPVDITQLIETPEQQENSENKTENKEKNTSETTKKSESAEKVKKSDSEKTSETTEKTEKSTVSKSENIQKNTQTVTGQTNPVKTTQSETTENSNQKKTETSKNTSTATENTNSSGTNKTEFGFPEAVNHAQLVFLFDDGGQNLSQLEKFLKLPFPITIAVLPQLAHSKESAQKIREAGKELMLHQPMQAINENVNPGPGAIKPDMNEDQIIATLFQNLNEIGPVDGMNNHEGSAITADAEKMAVVMKIASENGIYFLDSRTNKDTQVPYVCQELGYSYYERNGNFLDNVKTRENALTELRKNIDIANKNGVVIMIGHIWSADFLPQLLLDVYPELKAKGYVITTVSKCKGKK